MRIRNWCFTKFAERPPAYTKHMRYLCYQKEKCPDSGRYHWQGYVEFSEGLTMKAVKTIFMDETIHLEPRKGTQQQAIAYCRKTESAVDGSFRELGELKIQGSRSDLNSIWEAVESGATKLELLKEFKGNALRHLGMIDRAQKAVHHFDDIDNYIYRYRRTLAELTNIEEKCHEPKHTEVAGNTTRPPVSKKLVEWSDADSDDCDD